MNAGSVFERRHRRVQVRGERFIFGESPPRMAGVDAFTLVEALVSLTIVVLLLGILLTMTNQITTIWNYTSGRGEQFRESREAFETITRRLSLATLNTYWDYVDGNGLSRSSSNSSTFQPASYSRQSELRFICGPMVTGSSSLMKGVTPPAQTNWVTDGVFFQAPRGISEPGVSQLAGLLSMLNTWGYFVEFGPDSALRPNIPGLVDGTRVPLKYRFRLCEMIQPANQLTIYSFTSGHPEYAENTWFTPSLSTAPRPLHVVADNVVALVLIPKLTPQEDPTGAALAPGYSYSSGTTGQAAQLSGTAAAAVNSKNQLPPVIQVTMVAADEASYGRLQAMQPGGNTMPTSLGLATLFQNVGDITNSGNPGYAKDLQTLQNNLQASHVNYRVFTTNVRIKGARWSEDQTN